MSTGFGGEAEGKNVIGYIKNRTGNIITFVIILYFILF
jgi:hypothetical protein